MPSTQPETMPTFVFCFDPSDEFASVGGFDWFWTKSHALDAFEDACARPCYDADNLSVLEVLVPVSVIRQGSGAVSHFLDLQVCLGPGRGVVGLLRERPAKSGAQS